MPFEELSRFQEAAEDVKQAVSELEPIFQRLIAALDALPKEIRPRTSAEALEILSQYTTEISERAAKGVGDEEEEESENEHHLPTPTQAILSLLANHPNGLTPAEIITNLRGKFYTKVPDDKKSGLIYSTLSQLRSRQTVLKDEAGRHRLPRHFPAPDGDDGYGGGSSGGDGDNIPF